MSRSRASMVIAAPAPSGDSTSATRWQMPRTEDCLPGGAPREARVGGEHDPSLGIEADHGPRPPWQPGVGTEVGELVEGGAGSEVAAWTQGPRHFIRERLLRVVLVVGHNPLSGGRGGLPTRSVGDDPRTRRGIGPPRDACHYGESLGFGKFGVDAYASNHSPRFGFPARSGPPRHALLLRPSESMTTRHEREHQQPPQRAFPKGTDLPSDWRSDVAVALPRRPTAMSSAASSLLMAIASEEPWPRQRRCRQGAFVVDSSKTLSGRGGFGIRLARAGQRAGPAGVPAR